MNYARVAASAAFFLLAACTAGDFKTQTCNPTYGICWPAR